MKTKVKNIFILYILIAQLTSILITYFQRMSPEVELETGQAAGLSIFYVVMIFLTTIIIISILRRRLFLLVKLLFISSIFISLTVSLYLLLVPYNLTAISIPISLVLTYILNHENKFTPYIQSVTAAIIAQLVAQLLGWKFPFFFLIFLSMYDIYAVFKGPLRTMFRTEKEVSESVNPEIRKEMDKAISPALLKTGNLAIGYGDLFSYSLAASITTQLLNPMLIPLNILAMYIGIYVTMRLTIKHHLFPGLPIPILLWATTLIILQKI